MLTKGRDRAKDGSSRSGSAPNTRKKPKGTASSRALTDKWMVLGAEDYLLDFFSAFAAFFSFIVFVGFFFVSFF
jgi:hypothetical protein